MRPFMLAVLEHPGPALASLSYTLSVSEYVTANVTAKPVTFLHETNYGCTVVLSHVQLQHSHCYKEITFLTVYHTG